MNTERLNTIAKITAIMVAVLGLQVFFVLLMFMWGAEMPQDQRIMALGALYFAGLFLGLKWRGVGGLISFITALFFLISQAINTVNYPYFFNFLIIVVALILMAPGLLFLMVWYRKRRAKKGE